MCTFTRLVQPHFSLFMFVSKQFDLVKTGMWIQSLERTVRRKWEVAELVPLRQRFGDGRPSSWLISVPHHTHHSPPPTTLNATNRPNKITVLFTLSTHYQLQRCHLLSITISPSARILQMQTSMDLINLQQHLQIDVAPS